RARGPAVGALARAAARLAGGVRRGLRGRRHDHRQGDPRRVRHARDRRHHGRAHPRLALRGRAGPGRRGVPVRRDGLVHDPVRRGAGRRAHELGPLRAGHQAPEALSEASVTRKEVRRWTVAGMRDRGAETRGSTSSGWPTAARVIVERLRDITPKPVRYVVNTHFHWDHWHGNEVYPAAYPHAEIVTNQLTREAMLRKGLKRIQDHVRQVPDEIAKLEADLAAARSAAE